MTAHHRLDNVVDRPLIVLPDHVEVVAVSDNPSDRSAFAMFGALTGIATLTAALIVGGAALGLLVDNATSAPHVFVFLGLGCPFLLVRGGGGADAPSNPDERPEYEGDACDFERPVAAPVRQRWGRCVHVDSAIL